jgi:acyl-CoA hydrolase
MGNSLKGVALIFELEQNQITEAFNLGVEMGFFYQFGIFSYIMTAIINQGEKQRVKEHLKKVSQML